MRAAFLALTCLACEGVAVHQIPPEPDAGFGMETTTDAGHASTPNDSGVPETSDATSIDAGCDPATHQPTACRSGECFGAVLCIAGELHCVAPACTTPPDPDECEGPDYVLIHDRTESMRPVMPFVQAMTSSLAQHRDRNLFFFDVPGFSRPSDAGPSAHCYHSSQGLPLPPCITPWVVADLLDTAYWGSYEATLDVLAGLPDSVQWTPGRARHVFLFADERPQGVRTAGEVVARLVPARVRVHIYTTLDLPKGDLDQYLRIAVATGGSLNGFAGGVYDPCP